MSKIQQYRRSFLLTWLIGISQILAWSREIWGLQEILHMISKRDHSQTFLCKSLPLLQDSYTILLCLGHPFIGLARAVAPILQILYPQNGSDYSIFYEFSNNSSFRGCLDPHSSRNYWIWVLAIPSLRGFPRAIAVLRAQSTSKRWQLTLKSFQEPL